MEQVTIATKTKIKCKAIFEGYKKVRHFCKDSQILLQI